MNNQQMQSNVNQIFAAMGAQTNLVFVRPIKTTIAAAVGVKLNETVTILGLNSPAVGGFIYVNEKILNKSFTDSEIDFILAHECAHIFNNHTIATLFWNLFEKALKGEKNENYELIEIIKIGFVILSKSHLPPNAETLRDQEYEADRIAVSITHDLTSAVSCLSKLAGNNMNAPSHMWELFDKALPAMKMGQRIEALRRNMGFI